MGQYWVVTNLDKREFVQAHRLGCGLKLWEQLANHPGTGAALIILTAAEREARGGGDLDLEQNWHGPERTFPEHSTTPGPMPESYQEIARRTIGRWAGDRIALIGDYAERSDLPEDDQADLIYDLCGSEKRISESISYQLERANQMRESGNIKGAEQCESLALRLSQAKPFKDISDDVCAVIEHELQGKFTGEGWRDFTGS